jgi:hypothetical protein
MAIESGRLQNDHYNFVRALLEEVKLAQKASRVVTRQQIDECVRAYSYLYNERIGGLFATCHNVLWKVFKSNNDQQNLLTLYRYSSLVWRLRGEDDKEKKYREDLARLLGNQLAKSILAVGRDLRYFLSRNVPARAEIENSSDVSR